MSDQERETPYVYQPYGAFGNCPQDAERLWGVAIGGFRILKGLTKDDAHMICGELADLRTALAAIYTLASDAYDDATDADPIMRTIARIIELSGGGA